MLDDLKWYVATTYSSYEDKVKNNLKTIIEKDGLQDVITAVEVPVEEIEVESKKINKDTGKEETVKRKKEVKIYPGYVFIKMIMSERTWYAVRNIRGCTGFVGATNEDKSQASPLSEQEIKRLEFELNKSNKSAVKINFVKDDEVTITNGPYKGLSGKVSKIDENTQKVYVLIAAIGNKLSEVELDAADIEKVVF